MATRLLLPGTADEAIEAIVRGYAAGGAVRVVNFHATPSYRAEEYRRQIALYARYFTPMNEGDLDEVFAGAWSKPKPGLIPVLFEGFRDNLDVVLPMLEDQGFTAWFFMPSAFPGVPPDDQRSYAKAHVLHLPKREEYAGERVALTWAEARGIAERGHVFACHSRTHNELRPETPLSVLEDEIVAGKAEMEEGLEREVKTFCWLRGAEMGINADADRLLREAGFRYLFSNFKIQKLQ